ncbi:MAG TPA: glycosyltransferase family 4 protein [Acidimicrobiales bacterium]
MTDLRIGIVCPYSLSLPGGVQGQVLSLARALRGMGHTTRVIAPCDGPPPDASVIPVGVSVPFAANGSVAPIAPDPAAAVRTLRAVRDHELEVLHLHEPLVPGPCLTSLLARPVPLVGTFHAAGGFPLYRLTGPVLRRVVGRLDIRCAVSDEAAELATTTVGGTYERVFNGIDVERFADATPWPSERPTVFFVGRHEPRKGLRTLIDAMAHLGDDIELWVGGEGPETKELRALAGDDERIIWLGRLDDGELARRLRGADVFCAPSTGGESFGIVLLEAMAAGTPIVAGDNPGYRRVASDGTQAVLVEPEDSRGLADALREVLSDGSRAEALVAAGRARAAEFAMERLAEIYVDLYQRART